MFFEPMDDREDGAIGIYSTSVYMERPDAHPEADLIGILIPEAQGFRLAMSKPPHNDDVGGGLIFVWNGGPVSMRFDVVTQAQQELPLLPGGRT